LFGFLSDLLNKSDQVTNGRALSVCLGISKHLSILEVEQKDLRRENNDLANRLRKIELEVFKRKERNDSGG